VLLEVFEAEYERQLLDAPEVDLVAMLWCRVLAVFDAEKALLPLDVPECAPLVAL